MIYCGKNWVQLGRRELSVDFKQEMRADKNNYYLISRHRRSQWPRGLRRGSAAARWLGLRVRIPLGKWMSVSYECCVLSVRILCVRLITPIECGVSKCDREASIMRMSWLSRGCCAMQKKSRHQNVKYHRYSISSLS